MSIFCDVASLRIHIPRAFKLQVPQSAEIEVGVHIRSVRYSLYHQFYTKETFWPLTYTMAYLQPHCKLLRIITLQSKVNVQFHINLFLLTARLIVVLPLI